MIILTAAQADALRGETSPGHVLDPIALKNGSYALPESVLTDPAHEAKWPVLSALPRRDVDPSELPQSGEP